MAKAGNGGWYVNTKTGEITQGKRLSWGNRLGPYPTAEAASQWRGQIAARNTQADNTDLDWED